MEIEILGGSKKWRDSLLEKLAEEIDPQSVFTTGVAATRPTDRKIANSRALWDEYIDPDGLTDDDEWEDATVEERMVEMQKMFTQEETA